MIAHERHQLIVRRLRQRSFLSLAELELLLGASPATIRRDLGLLEKFGKVQRTHGGVLSCERADDEPSFDRRARAAISAKHAIAAAACALVRPGESVFIDAGSTALEAGRALARVEGLTISTNSIPLLSLTPARGTRIVSLGGEVRAVSRALVGVAALDWVQRLRFDVALLGASGIEVAEGPSTTELTEASLKTAVASRARRVVLLADATKWGSPAPVRFADWSVIHDLFTDRRLTSSERQLLAPHGVRVHTVGTAP